MIRLFNGSLLTVICNLSQLPRFGSSSSYLRTFTFLSIFHGLFENLPIAHSSSQCARLNWHRSIPLIFLKIRTYHLSLQTPVQKVQVISFWLQKDLLLCKVADIFYESVADIRISWSLFSTNGFSWPSQSAFFSSELLSLQFSQNIHQACLILSFFTGISFSL